MLVVVGDGDGHVGIWVSEKLLEIPEAVRKATEDAKKNLIKVPIVGTTIPPGIWVYSVQTSSPDAGCSRTWWKLRVHQFISA